MSTYPLFYDSVDGDRVYNADSFSNWLRRFFTNGVFNGEMIVRAAGGMTVSVSGGYVNINGKVQVFDPATLTITAAASNLYRKDAIVVERNDTDRNFYLKVVAGTSASSEASAAAPAPVRSGAIYQIVIAQILVAPGVTSIYDVDITDTRMDSQLCGYVTGTVEEIDFSEIEAQFQDWFDRVKDTLSEDAAGHLLDITDALGLRIDDVEETIGDTPMGTEATTLTGAIAEHNADLVFMKMRDHVHVSSETASATAGEYKDVATITIPANNTGYDIVYRVEGTGMANWCNVTGAIVGLSLWGDNGYGTIGHINRNVIFMNNTWDYGMRSVGYVLVKNGSTARTFYLYVRHSVASAALTDLSISYEAFKWELATE